MSLQTFAREASDWLNYWQDLVAAIIGAAFLTGTVGWTLLSERRRQKSEAAAFRLALGAEIRQLAAATLGAYLSLRDLVGELNPTERISTISATQIGLCCKLPEPVVYPRGADRLGMLGERAAFDAVYFYGQLALILETVRHVSQLRDLRDQRAPLGTRQLLEVMRALLNAVSAALDALPAFSTEIFSDQDAVLAARFAAAHDDLEKLLSPPDGKENAAPAAKGGVG